MKQKYTITIADVSLNVVCDESPEAVEALVGIVDRHMREINSKSNRCSKTEAALLCALDYCADKVKMQRKTKKLWRISSMIFFSRMTVATLFNVKIIWSVFWINLTN